MSEWQRRKAREAARRKEEERFSHIGCEVWTRSSVGVWGGIDWYLIDAMINEAVRKTRDYGPTDEQWIASATQVVENFVEQLAKRAPERMKKPPPVGVTWRRRKFK